MLIIWSFARLYLPKINYPAIKLRLELPFYGFTEAEGAWPKSKTNFILYGRGKID